MKSGCVEEISSGELILGFSYLDLVREESSVFAELLRPEVNSFFFYMSKKYELRRDELLKPRFREKGRR